MRRGLGDDQGAAIGRDRHAVGEAQIACHDSGAAVGFDAGDHAGIHRLVGGVKKIVANVTDVHAVVTVDDAIAQAKDRARADIRHLSQRLAVPAVNLSAQRVADHDAAVAAKAKAVRFEGQFQHHVQLPLQIDGPDGLTVDIQKPPLAVAPARALGELHAVAAVEQQLRCTVGFQEVSLCAVAFTC